MRFGIALLLLTATSAFAVDGTIVNGTTGKPQAGAAVTLLQITSAGPQVVNTTQSAADGTFNIATPVGGAPGPKLVQANYKGVVYNKMIPPGTPDTGVRVDVFDSSSKPENAKVTTHMLLLEPSNGQMTVSESFIYTNTGKVAYNDAEHGTLQFYVPPEAAGKIQMNVTAPNSVAVRATPVETAIKGVYKLNFPVKPGESHIDLTYQMPFTTPSKFATKILFRQPNTKLLAPVGVTLSGPGLQPLGQEPRTQATIFNVDGPKLEVNVVGSGALARGGDEGTTTTGAAGGANDANNDSDATIAELYPQLYGKASPADGFLGVASSVKWILLLLLGTLALGFVYQYRRGA